MAMCRGSSAVLPADMKTDNKRCQEMTFPKNRAKTGDNPPFLSPVFAFVCSCTPPIDKSLYGFQQG
jgi:hypothetical protein